MRTFQNLLLVCLISCPLGVFCQNWAPHSMGLDYFFNTPPPGTTPSLKSTQLRIIDFTTLGLDTVWHYNRKARRNNDVFIDEQVNLFLEGWHWFTSNEIHFFNSTGDTVALRLQNTGSWSFANNGNDTIEILSRDTAMVHGVLDSVITYQVSTGDTIQLSQSHGLLRCPDLYQYLQWPDPDQHVQYLAPQPQLTYLDYFPYQPGDYLLYHENEQTYPSLTNYDSWILKEVTDCEDFPTYSVVTFSVMSSTNYLSGQDPSFFQQTETIVYGEFNHPLVGEPSGLIYQHLQGNYYYLQPIGVDNLGVPSRTTTYASPQGTNTYQVSSTIHDQIWTKGKGMVWELRRTGGQYVTTHLECWRIGADSSGDCPKLLDFYYEQGLEDRIVVFPNPTEGDFQIKFNANESFTGADCDIVNNLGQVVWKGITPKTFGSISPGYLPEGVYYFRILAEQPVITKLWINR